MVWAAYSREANALDDDLERASTTSRCTTRRWIAAVKSLL